MRVQSSSIGRPGERWRAPYASDAALSRGRLRPEAPSATRNDFQRDRDRVLHSTAFRRLAHKTQVFVAPHGDHFRTRLTHTIEVSQIARSIARSLGLDEDLAETVALAHDLGHPPFGHTGEDALDACMTPFGGFDHNAQALRIVTRLERRYAGHDGLNLSWESVEGIVKHNGPLLDVAGAPTGRYRERGVPGAILEHDALQGLRLETEASAEAQAAALADDIAYDAHDIDDGLRAGLLALEDLDEVPFLGSLRHDVEAEHGALEPTRAIHEIGRRVITRFVEDAIREGGRRLDALQPRDADAIRTAGAPLIAFSEEIAATDRAIKSFLMDRVYRHADVLPVRDRAARVVAQLFERFRNDMGSLPDSWRAGLDPSDEARVARRVADYVAGMTDRFALDEHRRLFGRGGAEGRQA